MSAHTGCAIDRERDYCIVDGDRCDRDRVGLRVCEADADLAGVELDSPDIDLVERRWVLADEVEQ